MEQRNDTSAMVEPIPLGTVGLIVQESGCTRDQVLYVIRSRGVQPVATAAHMHVFSRAQVDFILSELAAIAAERGGAL